MFIHKKGSVFLSLFYASLICGVVVGVSYFVSPGMFETLHPLRFLLGSLTLTLTMLTVTYRYFKHLHAECDESGSCKTAEDK
jgi:hypothetical protein